MKISNIKRSWSKVILGPLLGLFIAPLASFPIIWIIKKILWTSDNFMSGKLFLGIVSLPVICSLYIICFICFGALFAPAKRVQVATALYFTATLIAFYMLWAFPSPEFSQQGTLILWQPFTFTMLSGSLAYITVLLLEIKEKKQLTKVASCNQPSAPLQADT